MTVGDGAGLAIADPRDSGCATQAPDSKTVNVATIAFRQNLTFSTFR